MRASACRTGFSLSKLEQRGRSHVIPTEGRDLGGRGQMLLRAESVPRSWAYSPPTRYVSGEADFRHLIR